MIAFGHTATGAMVGLAVYKYLGNTDPLTGLLVAGTIGVISHYIFDSIPHGHFFLFKKSDNYRKKVFPILIFDVFGSVLLFTLAAYYTFGFNIGLFYILFGIGGAQLPDVIDGLIFSGFLKRSGIIKLENDFHIWTHWHGKFEKALLLSKWDLWQVASVLIALWLITQF